VLFARSIVSDDSGFATKPWEWIRENLIGGQELGFVVVTIAVAVLALLCDRSAPPPVTDGPEADYREPA
jgi:hypothetical protein